MNLHRVKWMVNFVFMKLVFCSYFVNRTIYFCLFTSFFVVSECLHPVVFLNYVYTCIFNLLFCLPYIILIFFTKVPLLA